MEKVDCIFVSAGALWDNGGEEAELTSENGIFTFDKKKLNPNKDRPYLVRVVGGFQAFKTKTEAKKYYNQEIW